MKRYGYRYFLIVTTLADGKEYQMLPGYECEDLAYREKYLIGSLHGVEARIEERPKDWRLDG